MSFSEKAKDTIILKKLSERLDILTINDLRKEQTCYDEKIKDSNGQESTSLADMSVVLKKITDYAPPKILNNDTLGKDTDTLKLKSPVIPDDFRCPISLELMKDPVIVSSGQTYERVSIQKWINAGHKTCPKTQQLLSKTLTPNYVLKSLIAQWCESNGLELPQQHGASHDNKLAKSKSDCDTASINSLLQKLKHGGIEEQRAASGHLRLLAKRNADNRVCIAEAGAIPLLVSHLASSDARTQEHTVTALLNLSINEVNKRRIVDAGAIPGIVQVVKNGSMEARENAAATLFSLSVIDANKVKIGEVGAMPALIKLLSEGSPRGKKDAVTAIFNLSINNENKVRAIKADIVNHLMKMLKDSSGGMVDEALTIMAILASHPEGKTAIANAKPIPMLVVLLRTGSPRNRENSAAVLSALCTDDEGQVMIAKLCGAQEALKNLSNCGTDRAKRKATTLLEFLQKNDQPSEDPKPLIV